LWYPGENGEVGWGSAEMRYIITVSAAVRLGFWMLAIGVILGFILGIHV
jgi:hypothetical protein